MAENTIHLMVDLETMGTKSGSAIVALAAVPFHLETGVIPQGLNPFYRNISLQSAMDAGLVVDASTIQWWMSQSKEASEMWQTSPRSLGSVLEMFHEYVTALRSVYDQVYLWGNSARFDLGLIENAYTADGVWEIPWDFRNERCVRTLLSFAPEVRNQTKFEGTRHNALDDCAYQIAYSCAAYKKLTGQ